MPRILTNVRGETVKQAADRYVRTQGGPVSASAVAQRRAINAALELAFYQELTAELTKREGFDGRPIVWPTSA